MNKPKGTFGFLDEQHVDKAVSRVHALDQVIAAAQLEGAIDDELELIVFPAFQALKVPDVKLSQPAPDQRYLPTPPVEGAHKGDFMPLSGWRVPFNAWHTLLKQEHFGIEPLNYPSSVV